MQLACDVQAFSGVSEAVQRDGIYGGGFLALGGGLDLGSALVMTSDEVLFLLVFEW